MAINTFTGATSSNWGTASNWSLGAVPLAGDGNIATLDASSPDCTINSTQRVCNAFDASAYLGTLTFAAGLSVSGDITLGASMTFAGASALLASFTGTFTSNGATVTVPLTFNGGTITLAMDITCSALVSIGNSGNPVTLNGNTLNCGAGLSLAGSSSGTIGGTTQVILTGTGTVTGSTSNTAGGLKLPLTINTTGTITFNSLLFSGSMTHIAGTVITIGSSLRLSDDTTLNVAGITWDNIITINNSKTHTLTSDLNLTGSLVIGVGTSTTTFNGPGAINASGSVTHGGTTSVVTGTATINLTGTGTITGSTNAGNFQLSMAINTAGTITFANGDTFCFGGSTLTYTAGTIITTNHTLLLKASTITFNTAGVTWGTVDCGASATPTYTINSTLRTRTLILPSTTPVIFTGSAGFDVDTLTATNVGVTRTLQSSVTYRVRLAITISASKTNMAIWQSSTFGTRAILILDAAATQEVAYITAIDIDSNGGQQIKNYQGTNTNTLNWVVYPTTRPTLSYTFVG